MRLWLTIPVLVVCLGALTDSAESQMRRGPGRPPNLASGRRIVVAQETFPVPGLGFDFAHLAAIGGVSGTRFIPARPIVPVTPILLPAFLQPQVIIVQQPPVVIVQQPPSVEVSPEPAKPSRSDAHLEPQEFLSPPLREVPEYVFVRRDGSLFLAVAFSTKASHLAYVTREGLLRTVSLSDLDLETTRRMNEDRGTSLSLSF